jgi:nucleoside-diphosphate-sugar epimerase
MSARVLIAGCGFVGNQLAEQLAERGCNVFALRRSDRAAPRGAQAVRADLARIETLGALPERIDIVIYTAGASEPSEAAYRAAYLDGVDHLLRVLRERGEMPRRLLFCSSTAVYAQHRGEWVDEDSPTRPVGFRGEILLSAERLLHALAPSAIVVRFGGIYGPGRTRLVDNVRTGEARIRPDEHFTNRIHRDDAAGVLELLALAERPADSLYLGVDDEPAEEAEMLRYFASRLGVTEPPPHDAGALPARRTGSKRCRNTRIRGEGYSFAYPSFREGYAAALE